MPNPSFISKPLALAFASTLLVACNDDTTNTDEVGSMSDTADTGEVDTTADGDESSESESSESSESESSESESSESSESESSESESSESSESESTDTGDPMCNISDLEDIEIDFNLVGSMSPPGSCNDFVFTGQLEGGGGGSWNLDACPCGAACLIPDPYTFSVSLPDASLQPNMPACPEIRVDRDPESCAIVSVVIENVSDPGRAIWIAANQLPAPASVTELEVAAELVGACECPGDCEPPSLHRLVFDWLGESLELIEGESGMLPADDGDWAVTAINSHVYADQSEWYGWVMKR